MSKNAKLHYGFLLLYIILLVLLPYNESFSQCCAAGNPVSGNQLYGTGTKNNLEFSVSYLHSFSDTYYQGVDKSDYDDSDIEFDFGLINLSYGLTKDIKLIAEAGYFISKKQNLYYTNYDDAVQKGYGFGDAAFGFTYNLYTNDEYKFRIYQSNKMTLPVGNFDQKYGSVVLPIDLQPSSGNYKYDFGLVLSKSFPDLKFSLISINNFEISQFIQTKRTNYKYGNQYNVSLLGIYNFTDDIAGALQIRSQIREKALAGYKDTSGTVSYQFINSTGGIVFFLSPQFNINLFNEYRFGLQYDIPVYKNMNGIQLTNKYAFSLNASKKIDFSQMPDSELDTNNIQKQIYNPVYLKQKEISVEGLCDMCKDRIENTAKEHKNVVEAEWNSENNVLTILFSEVPDFDRIKKALAEAGHDNESYKADDEVYNALPKCCMYRINIENHK